MSHGAVSTSTTLNQTSTFNRNLITRPNNVTPTTTLTFKPFSSPSRSPGSPFRTTTGRLRAVSAVQASTESSFYELLGVPESGTLPEIKQAYKKLARKYHPDVSLPECVQENTKKFIELQEAYETLSDPNMRASYDRHLGSGLHLAFSSRNQFRDKRVWDVMGGGRNRWESQVSELKRRSTDKELRRETSWAARIRRQNGREDVV